MLSLLTGRTGLGDLSEGIPFPGAAFPTALVRGSAKREVPCCEHSSLLKAPLLLRRNKSTGAKSWTPKTCSPAVRNSDINAQQC